jgi:hypothetical protein
VTTVLPNRIENTNISLALNGTDMTAGLAFAGTATDRSVTYAGPLTANAFYTGVIVARDDSGRATTNTWTFDTVDEAAALMFEAEDYNYSNAQLNPDFTITPPTSGGLFLDNPLPSAAGVPQPTSYTDRIGMAGVDFWDTETNIATAQNVYRLYDPVGTQEAQDTLRQKYVTNLAPDYQLQQIRAGEWLNYTRTFGATNYTVYLRASSTADQQVRLDQVTSDPTKPNQTTMLFGLFKVQRGGGYKYVQLTDNLGAPIVLGLSGVQTLRLTALGAANNLNLNFLLFVPTAETASLLGPIVESSSPAPGTTSAHPRAALVITLVNRLTILDTSSLQLELDGANVTAASTITPQANGATVQYQPPAALALGSTHTVKLVYRDTAAHAFASEWSFTVTTDADPPSLVAARSSLDPNTQLLRVELTFSEPVGSASATNRANYAISRNVTVTGVTMSADPATVIITATGARTGAYYILTVNNVKDVGGNLIWPNSTIRFNPSPFEEDANGFLVVEAENYLSNTPGTGSSPEVWTLVTDKPGYSGVGAMQTLPDNGGTSPSPDQLAQSPRMDYRVKFIKTGTHYVWIRGSAGTGGPGGTTGNSDSLHFGVDGQHVVALAGINNTAFVWSRSIQSSLGNYLFDVVAPGEYALNIWMREDGSYLDRILITTNANYTPAGLGPDESGRTGDPIPPIIDITNPVKGQTFALNTPITITAQVTDPDSPSALVEFFINGNKAGEDNTTPYSITVPALADGRYTLVAKATDETGMSRSSVPVRIQAGNPPPQILFVVGDPSNLNASDAGLKNRLESFGFQVAVIDDSASTPDDALFNVLIITASTVSSGNVTTKFRDAAVPVLNWEQALQDDYAMTGNNTDPLLGVVDRGETTNQTSITIVTDAHPLAAGLARGTRPVTTEPTTFTWGVPAPSATIIAAMTDDPTQAALYAYDTGASMVGGFVAPARRVHIFQQDNAFAVLNQDGLKLVEAALSWAMNRPLLPPAQPVLLKNTAKSGGNFTFGFDTLTGRKYRVQYCQSLSQGAWTDLRTETGTGGQITITDAIAAAGSRFYRVISE